MAITTWCEGVIIQRSKQPIEGHNRMREERRGLEEGLDPHKWTGWMKVYTCTSGLRGAGVSDHLLNQLHLIRTQGHLIEGICQPMAYRLLWLWPLKVYKYSHNRSVLSVSYVTINILLICYLMLLIQSIKCKYFVRGRFAWALNRRVAGLFS